MLSRLQSGRPVVSAADAGRQVALDRAAVQDAHVGSGCGQGWARAHQRRRREAKPRGRSRRRTRDHRRARAADRDRARHGRASRVGRTGADALRRDREEHRTARAPGRIAPARRARRGRPAPDQARPSPLRRRSVLARRPAPPGTEWPISAHPWGVWYQDNFAQDVAFQRNIEIWFGWLAKYNSVYNLGSTEAQVARTFNKAQNALAASPAAGEVGPDEWAAIFLEAGYYEPT